MKWQIFLTLLVIFITDPTESDRFLISAPRVFHVDVKEKVFVQMGGSHLNNIITLHLEDQQSRIVSERKTVTCTTESEVQTVELMIDTRQWSNVRKPELLLLVAESPSFTKRKMAKVWVSKNRGHIFIQTDQPMYNPSDKVYYRIFTLDHALKPHTGTFEISVLNAAGNKVMRVLKTAAGGIFKDSFTIPDVSKVGTWKIMANYHGDNKAASREFKVQRFVLPSFEVSIRMEQPYILINDENINFVVSAIYSHGETVNGSYHCHFVVMEKVERSDKKENPQFIKELEFIGSVINGAAAVSLQTSKLNEHLQMQFNQTLSDLQQSGAQLSVGVFVINEQSGEMQETQVILPIISHRYSVDLSRTHSYFLPGFPLDVVVVMRHPDGSRAAGVPVTITVPSTSEGQWQGNTDQEGAVSYVFNIQSNPAQITVDVSADDLQVRKEILQASSDSGSYLYLSITHKTYNVNDLLGVTFNTKNAPNNGYIYYMVLSRGVLVSKGSLRIGSSVKDNILITTAMVPSFRLIGYYYSQNSRIVADSVWVDVRDECEIKVKVEKKGPFQPGRKSVLQFDLNGQRAKVALLVVDKAFYGLKADNKLTPEQVFSSMQSYDIGCSYGGGSNQVSVLTDAGLSFVSQADSDDRRGWECNSLAVRRGRSADFQQALNTLQSNYTDQKLHECCARGFTLIPMRRSCEERARRVSLAEAEPACAKAFLTCCREGEKWRQKKMREEEARQLSRTSIADIEQFFYDATQQYIRRYFPPSFAFTELDVDGTASYDLRLPDSITTWEIQVATLSADTGFCVVKPSDLLAFKEVFVSLRLPFSVKKFEQLAISPVIYNYGDEPLHLAVHMEQTEGLCSPGSATTVAFVNITIPEKSSKFVSFSAVPMTTGQIPIKIRVYDIDNERGIDAIEKMLNVWAEGIEHREEETKLIKFDQTSSKEFFIHKRVPDNSVPGSDSNVFISMEGVGFGNSHVRKLLSPENMAALIKLPTGCSEQTTTSLAPTALAVRYLDATKQWTDLPVGARDDALDKIEAGFVRVLTFKKSDGAYRPWYSSKPSTWLTALVVKVLSMVAERQNMNAEGPQGRSARAVPEEQIRQSVRYLLSVQSSDGSFNDQHSVLHLHLLQGQDWSTSMTAYVTLALKRSLQFLVQREREDVKARISRATTFLQSNFGSLQNPYAVAITAYCLSICLPEGTDLSNAWSKLQLQAIEENGCVHWENNVRFGAIAIETTAYALLTAVAQNKTEWADKTACWLMQQENYYGGFRSSQDTIMALEALCEYELSRTPSPETTAEAEFSLLGRGERVRLTLQNKKERVETNLKKLPGNDVIVHITGTGDVKLKIEKAYYLLEPKSHCDGLSIRVRVEGKVKYVEKIIESYDYYEDDEVNEETESRVPRSTMEWLDARTRVRREIGASDETKETVTYHVCVSYNANHKLTGMAIADITLLSGFELVTEQLENLKQPPEKYISHYETSPGRLLIYFNELFEQEECIEFDAIQRVPIGLLQPAPASFYDYYEPTRKCTVFYSAPQRSKMISTLCSEDVCQCAERPCHKVQSTFMVKGTRKNDRVEYACFSPTVDYAYIVEVFNISMKSNFELYTSNVIDVLKSHGDTMVEESSLRVFAKRRQCKGQLELGTQYLIMGKDGLTTDTQGDMQYLLESNTWVEKMPSQEECTSSHNRPACRILQKFKADYKVDGCRQ